MPTYRSGRGGNQYAALTQPVWQYGLCNADWLFGQKPQEANTVGFFVLSKIDDDRHLPNRSVRMTWGALPVQSHCILPRQPTTGVIMPPVVTCRSPRASGRLSQPMRLMAMGCSTLCARNEILCDRGDRLLRRGPASVAAYAQPLGLYSTNPMRVREHGSAV
jgi:hypothetical protein